MEKSIKITVEQRHFAESTGYDDNHKCPLALAFKEQLNLDNSQNWGVGGSYLRKGGDFYKIDIREWTSTIVKMKIKNAKEGTIVEPITLNLIASPNPNFIY